MSGNRRKIKLKNPANLLSAVAVLIMSIILSLVIHQNFFLVFLSAFLVYVAAYVFFEKRRLQRFTAEDDVEAENEYAEQEDAPAKKRHWSASRSSSFDIMKTAKFKDSAVEEPTTTAASYTFSTASAIPVSFTVTSFSLLFIIVCTDLGPKLNKKYIATAPTKNETIIPITIFFCFSVL